MSLLSVIIPIYNGSQYIADTINSALDSDYENIEIVVVNDGSKDNSADIVADLQKKDNRIHLYNKENGGVVSARNFGSDHANGDFICFADQDDIIKPFMYLKLMQKLDRDGSDMAMCSSGRSIEGKESGYDCLEDGFYQNDEIREQLLYPILFNGYKVPLKMGSGNHYPSIWTCVFRRQFWENAGLKFRAYVNFEDDLLVKVEALSKAKKVSTISDIGYLWRVNLRSETYAHHFVMNLREKQDAEYNDMASSLQAFNPSDEFMTMFKQVTYCKQYVDAIHYLSSPEVKKKRFFIREYYAANIYSRDFKTAIEGRKYLKHGRIKPGIILPLIEKHNTLLSYKAEMLLDRILLISLHSQFLTKLERKIKK